MTTNKERTDWAHLLNQCAIEIDEVIDSAKHHYHEELDEERREAGAA